MTVFNMSDDFHFIFPKKADRYKNVMATSVDFRRLEKEYCICFYKKADSGRIEEVINLITFLRFEYAGLQHGKLIFNSESKKNCERVKKFVLEVIKKDIDRKMRMFTTARQFHNDMKNRYKNSGTLCFSLFAEGVSGEPIPEHMKTLKALSSRFFNNIRSRTTFKHHVLGYFWVVLKNRYDNRPYLHVNFYVDTRDFNNVIGEEINACWFNALKAIEDKEGGVLHLTVTKEFQNGLLLRSTSGYSEQSGENHAIFTRFNSDASVITKDLNAANSEIYKQFTNNKDKQYFIHYLYALAKESYFIAENTHFFGSSSVVKRLK
ncbi:MULTISPECIES: hypothetical protein [Enterobacteriaceae]|uniref:Inovirus Gp2 family protein n=2 Tax=Enterobacteriaceae TaxID=543 RepID=A0A3R8ZY68_ENTCL|nr:MULTISPECIES: hypothetical protein [Enterobacteriaceae]HBQ1798230.1 hypothetical protein [Klebsiella pneumoniae]RSB30443.1 hypothetical protein EGK68_12225 [Enterobacter cloacae]UUX44926.1 hypothetical protein NUT96_21770 [Klebsiella aerogenes]HBX7388121.1 hypothetical protein [Klebsiella pneumoniae]HDZ1361515.1 hypothetical protein [Klebsiella pneumoniae]